MYQSPNFVKVDTKVKDVIANYGSAPQSCTAQTTTIDGKPASYTELGVFAASCIINNTSL